MPVSRNSKSNFKRPFNLLSKVAVTIMVIAVDLYRVTLAGLLGGRCRFSPSCSCYAREAFMTFGFRRGLLKTVRGLLRCHPWGGQGFDPVKPDYLLKR